MYVGTLGIVQAVRRPANICVVSGGRISGNIKDNRPITPVDIEIGHYIARNVFALFDTGSSESVLFLPDGRRRIGTDPYETGVIRGVNGVLEDVYYYDASIRMADKVAVDLGLIDVYERNFDIADMIIGMDIISLGTLTIDGKAKTFSFEL